MLTESSLRAALPKDKVYELTDANKRGEGALVVRVKPNGSRWFFYRYFVEGKRTYLQIGRHQQRPDDGGITLKDARQKAAEFKDDKREHGDPKLKQLEQEQKNKENRRKFEIESRQGTFQQLIDAYVEQLEKDEKASAKDTKDSLELHVTNEWPDLVKLKAKEITPDDISRILAKMIRKGITRRTNIIRAMLHAAFAYGASGDLDPARVATESVKFGLLTNPVSIVPRQTHFDTADTRILTDDELLHLWNEVTRRHSTTIRNALHAAILLGGQRITQLTMARWSAYDKDQRILFLTDTKGIGGPRTHILPISDWVASLIDEIDHEHDYIFSNGWGVPITVEHLSGVVRNIARPNGSDYRLGDLRRTAETRLASLGLKEEIRAHLLSHGRKSGVQRRHYDMWAYLPEKREALSIWEIYLSEQVGIKQQTDPAQPAESGQ